MKSCCKLNGHLVFQYNDAYGLPMALWAYHWTRFFGRWFGDCPLTHVDWEAGLTEMDFRGAELEGLSISYENWADSDFSGADLSETLLSHGCFQNARFYKAVLARANLRNSDFRESDLSFADLSTYDNFSSGANLAGADLRDAILHETNLHRILFDDQTRFPDRFRVEEFSIYKRPKKECCRLEKWDVGWS